MKKPRKPRSKPSRRHAQRAATLTSRAMPSPGMGGRLSVAALSGGARHRTLPIGLSAPRDERLSPAAYLAPLLLIAVLYSMQMPATWPLIRSVMDRSGHEVVTGPGRIIRPEVAAPVVDSARVPSPGPRAPELATAALDVSVLPRVPGPEVATAALDIATLPRAPGPEVTTAALDVAALPRVPAPEVATATLDVASLPRSPAPEVATAALDVATLPRVPAPEVATAALDVAALPRALGPEVATATLDVVALPAPPARPKGFLVGPKLRKEPVTQARHAALVIPVPAPPALVPLPGPLVMPPIDGPETAGSGPDGAVCRPSHVMLVSLGGGPDAAPRQPAGIAAPRAPKIDFGQALAAAALSQIGDFVIYDARYQRIGYPRGDVASLYGVCTDVVIRAYRALGIDLQVLVHESHSGRGDRSIDHRRTDVLRRFLAKAGESLAISDLPEDYRPGDIVTYWRPYNRASNAHIAVVSDVTAPSGRPMIVHNRGWGPQLEDALFADQITGHYRFDPAAARPAAATDKATRDRAAGLPRLVRRPLCPEGSMETLDGVSGLCRVRPEVALVRTSGVRTSSTGARTSLAR